MVSRFRSIAAALFGVLILAATGSARAEYKVRDPFVEKGEVELEMAGSITTAKNRARRNEYSQVYELAYGVTDWWMVEIEGELGRDAGPGNDRRWKATSYASKFQLFPQGEQWLDAGFFAEYTQSKIVTSSDSIKFGPLLQKVLGPTTATANFYLEKPIGPHAEHGAEASYAVQWRYDLFRILSPAVEMYGNLGDLDGMKNPRNQDSRVGPVALGKVGLGRAGELKYELGYLFGVNTITPDRTYKWKLEYEIAF